MSDPLAEKGIAAIASMMREETSRRRNAVIVAMVAIGLLLAFFLVRARAAGERLAVVLAVCGAALLVVLGSSALRMRRMMPVALGVGAVITLAFVAAAGDRGLYAHVGLHCAAIELLFVAVTALPLLLAMRKNADPVDPWRVAAWTALGGAIGAACLSIACSAHAALEHTLVFHAGAVAAALVLMRVMVRR